MGNFSIDFTPIGYWIKTVQMRKNDVHLATLKERIEVYKRAHELAIKARRSYFTNTEQVIQECQTFYDSESLVLSTIARDSFYTCMWGLIKHENLYQMWKDAPLGDEKEENAKLLAANEDKIIQNTEIIKAELDRLLSGKRVKH